MERLSCRQLAALQLMMMDHLRIVATHPQPLLLPCGLNHKQYMLIQTF